MINETENKKELPDVSGEDLSPLERIRGDSCLSPRIRESSKAYTRLIFFILIAALILIYIVKAYYHPVIVTGESMEPTYHNGQMLRTDSLITHNTVRRGSVICFRNDGGDLIKRVIGIPGDTVSFKDGYAYVNSVKLDDGFDRMNSCPGTVTYLREDEYYVLGDNRNNSTDSRYFGPIRYDSITAVVNEKAERYRQLYEEINEVLDTYEEIQSLSHNPADTEREENTDGN